MSVVLDKPLDDITTNIEKALEAGMSYKVYRNLVNELAKNNSNTGPEKTEALANYTMLNNKRMARWDKTLKIPADVSESIAKMDKKITWLVLTESWCGDAAPSLPVMNKLAEQQANISLKVVLRDEHPEVMDEFLTNGARSIPKLIALDTETHQVIGQWGPRGATATQMVADEKAKYGTIRSEFKQELQLFYNKNKGQDVLRDLLDLLSLE